MAVLLRDTNSVTHSVIVDTPTGGLTKGEVVLVGGSVYGFAFTAVSDTTTDVDTYAPSVTVVTQARQALVDKATGTGAPTFTQGETVYYNLTTGLAVKTGGGAIKIGYALAAVTESDATVLVDFDGTIGV